MKHNIILGKIEDLEGNIDKLECLIDILEHGEDNPSPTKESKKSDADFKPLTSFLDYTPELVDTLSDKIISLTNRINNIVRDEPKGVKCEN